PRGLRHETRRRHVAAARGARAHLVMRTGDGKESPGIRRGFLFSGKRRMDRINRILSLQERQSKQCRRPLPRPMSELKQDLSEPTKFHSCRKTKRNNVGGCSRGRCPNSSRIYLNPQNFTPAEKPIEAM